HEPVLLAEIEFAAGDDGVRPTRRAAVRDGKGALFLVTFRRGFDQSHGAVLVAEIEVAVGIDHRGGAVARGLPLLPNDLAGLQLDASGSAGIVAVAGVNVIADEDHAAVVVLQFSGAEEIDLFGPHAVAVALELEQSAALVVTGGAEDVIAVSNGGRDVGGAV